MQRLGLILLCVLVVLAVAVMTGATRSADVHFLELVHRNSSHVADRLWLKLNFLGGPQFSFSLAGLAIVIAIAGKHYREALFLALAFVLAGGFDWVLRNSFRRDRPHLWPSLIPDHSFVYSFPSGHATLAGTIGSCAIALTWGGKFRKPTAALAAIFVLIIGYSTLCLGVHYPSDLIEGWCLAGTSVIVAFILAERFAPERPAG